ncbi:aminotransferase class I/II-fold pyridoxal phosphate-dependent enzyme [Novosphingobium sp. Gsoil 351]|nr:aminotransferase class I/II-fold pyridoxal phosphate-dependent enzyme [Novosphingobium sp. Gsoil 351]
MGEPNFPTPPHIVEAAHRAARDGFTRYTETQGLPSLRAAWCDRLKRVNGYDTTPERLLVTAGAVSGLFATFAAILEQGDEILLPDPGWPNWSMMAKLIGARPIGYRCSPHTGWQPDLDHLRAQVTPRTKAVLVNSPGNPSGAVLDAATLRAISEMAERHDLWLISDECYDGIVFEGEHLGAAAVADRARTVTIVSCSKTYAMTGWRVGCVAAPDALVGPLAKVQQATLASVCAVAQKAAESALTGSQDAAEAMRLAYRQRRDEAAGLLAHLGRPIAPPGGAFYAMLDLSDCIADSTAFAQRLLDQERVAVAPGPAFGSQAPASVRVALCVDPAILEAGLRKLVAAAERSRQGALTLPRRGAEADERLTRTARRVRPASRPRPSALRNRPKVART